MVECSDGDASVTEAGVVLESWELDARSESFHLLGQMLGWRVRIFLPR